MSEDYFWSLKKQVEEEYHSLSLGLANITDDDLTENLYRRFSRQVDQMQDLFDRISEVNKDLNLDQSNPDLYKLLEGKQEISDLYGQFNRQRSIFFKRFAKFRSAREEEFVRERTMPEEPAEEPEELSEELPDEAVIWEDDYDPDAEKAEKQAARKARHKKLAAEAKKRDERNAQHRALQEEAARLGLHLHPDRVYSEADLHSERIRLEEELSQAEARTAERIRAEDESLRRHRERMEQSAQFEHLQHSHIDMSKEGIGQRPSSEADPAAASAGFAVFSQAPEYGRDKEVPAPEPERYPRDSQYHQPAEAPYHPDPSAGSQGPEPPVSYDHREPVRQAPHYEEPHTGPQPRPQDPSRPAGEPYHQPAETSYHTGPSVESRGAEGQPSYDQREPVSQASHYKEPQSGPQPRPQDPARPAGEPYRQPAEAPYHTGPSADSQGAKVQPSYDQREPVSQAPHYKDPQSGPQPRPQDPSRPAGKAYHQPAEAPYRPGPSADSRGAEGQPSSDQRNPVSQGPHYKETQSGPQPRPQDPARPAGEPYRQPAEAPYHTGPQPRPQDPSRPAGKAYHQPAEAPYRPGPSADSRGAEGQPSSDQRNPVSQGPHYKETQSGPLPRPQDPSRPAGKAYHQPAEAPYRVGPSADSRGAENQPSYGHRGPVSQAPHDKEPLSGPQPQPHPQDFRRPTAKDYQQTGPDNQKTGFVPEHDPIQKASQHKASEHIPGQSRDPQSTGVRSDPSRPQQPFAFNRKDPRFAAYFVAPAGAASSISGTAAPSRPQQQEPAGAIHTKPSSDISSRKSISASGYVPHQFTPAGTVPIAAAASSVKWSHAADSNAKIYSALVTNRDKGTEPLKASPVIETQMRFNVERARLAYMDAKGTAAAPNAVHEYIQQRNALSQYRSAVKKGAIQVTEVPVAAPVISPAGKGKSASAAPSQGVPAQSAVYSFTPSGTTARTVANGRLTGNHYEFRNPGMGGKPAYSPSNPMVVSSQYEAAITQKMHTATASLGSAIAKGDPKAVSVDPAKVKMYTDAYLAFQRAKRDGSVVVSQSGEGHDVPDYQAWQQRRVVQSSNKTAAGGALGTTGHMKGINPNQVSKKTVEEAVTNIFNRDSHLKQQSMASMYAKQIGYRFQTYTSGAFIRFSQQMYRVVQSGDDNSLRTMETGRYYITTAAGLVLAVHAGTPTKALERQVSKASAKEFNLYGTKSLLSNKQLSAAVNNGLRTTRELDAKIADLELKLAPFNEKIQQFAAANPYSIYPYTDNLAGLDKYSRYQYQKLSSQLERLQAERTAAGKNLKHHQNLQQMRHNAKLEEELLEKLKVDGKLPKNPQKLQEAAQKINEQASAEMKKRFGSLTKVTDKSLEKEISALKLQGKSLKAQIKALEGKGSALTQAERSLLMKLKAESKKLGSEISNLTKLSRARADLAFTNQKLDQLIKNAYKNKGRISNGLYALQSFMLRPLQAGYESNTEGLARMAQIASNRYVHLLVKKSFKASVFVAKASMEFLAPGSVQAAESAAFLAKTAVNAKVGLATNAAKTALHSGVNTVTTKITSAVPTGIKTSVHTVNSAVSATKNKVAVGIKNRAFQAKKWLSQTRVGRGVSAVRRVGTKTKEATKVIFTAAKGVGLKALAIFGCGFLLIGFISVVFSMVGGVVGTTVIASPDVSDGLVDLTPYMEILAREQAALDTEIYGYKQDGTYENVYVNYSGAVSNNKEILSMMAVRMCQELDMAENPEVEKYLVSLFADSHATTTTEREYSCSGCETKRRPATWYNPDTLQEEFVTEIDPYTGLETIVYEEVTYCPGHVDLTVNISVLRFDEIFTADTYANDGHTAVAGEKIGDFKITYYCCEKYEHICNAGPPYKTATGTTPTPGRTIAVDPDVIPLGSHVVIDGHEYVAEDTGGAIDGNRIDIVVKTHKEALNKGTRSGVPVYYPSYEGGSYEETGIWEGWTEDNIEWAKVFYSMPWDEIYTGYYEFGPISSSGTSGPSGSGSVPVDGDFTWPVPGYTTITSQFGYRDAPTSGASTNHKGIDISVPSGTHVLASAAGTVIGAGDAGNAGIMVTIDHGGGVLTKYMHHSRNVVKVGDVVEAGQLIAYSGNTGVSTGPHLHFQIEVNGTPQNPLNYVTPY